MITESDFEKAMHSLGHRSALPKTSGVYLMANTRSGRVYVGRSKNMRVRAGAHFSILKGGASDNPEMLSDFREHGEDSMQFAVLVELDDPRELDACERRAIRMAAQGDCYNKLNIGRLAKTTEVRGIYLPPELHQRLKDEARRMLEATKQEEAKP
jgi:hypothetical protein